MKIMQRTITTYLQHLTSHGGLTPPEQHQNLHLTRAHCLAPWQLLGQDFTLWAVQPGQTYTIGNTTVRTVVCSSIH
jgi:hypothetical protein